MKCKRCLDVFLSLFILLLLGWWLFPLLALLIWLTSGGPVFFRQKRTGLHGEEFYCLKFRTMIVNDESDVLQATIKDNRITRLGHFLRETNLDELPQFINVLIGHMSIVGPRPHMLYHTEKFSGMVDNYQSRHLVKPGITGLAQIKGYRGETPDLESIAMRVLWDVYYVQHHSVLLDLQIIGLTAVHFTRQIFSSHE